METKDTPDETQLEYRWNYKPTIILRQHMYLKHVVKVKCKVCSQIFITTRHLEEHIIRVYDTKKIQCENVKEKNCIKMETEDTPNGKS